MNPRKFAALQEALQAAPFRAGPLPAGTTIRVADSAGILEAIETLTTEVRAMRRELAALREVKAAPQVVRVAEPAKASALAPVLLDLDDVAAMVRLGVRAIRRMAAARQFPAALPIDEGRAERWRRTDVEAWARMPSEVRADLGGAALPKASKARPKKTTGSVDSPEARR